MKSCVHNTQIINHIAFIIFHSSNVCLCMSFIRAALCFFAPYLILIQIYEFFALLSIVFFLIRMFSKTLAELLFSFSAPRRSSFVFVFLSLFWIFFVSGSEYTR